MIDVIGRFRESDQDRSNRIEEGTEKAEANILDITIAIRSKAMFYLEYGHPQSVYHKSLVINFGKQIELEYGKIEDFIYILQKLNELMGEIIKLTNEEIDYVSTSTHHEWFIELSRTWDAIKCFFAYLRISPEYYWERTQGEYLINLSVLKRLERCIKESKSEELGQAELLIEQICAKYKRFMDGKHRADQRFKRI